VPVPENIVIQQLDLELNGGCNYKCPMCPQADGREKDFLKKLPFDVFTKIVDDAQQYGLNTVSLHGSGEPTLNRDMAKFVQYVKSKNVKCISFTNGSKLTADVSQELIEAGIDVLRISSIGYDRKSYAHWMSMDVFDEVRANIRTFVKLNGEMGGQSDIHLYHLITDLAQIDEEIAEYKRNWVEPTGAKSEIWLMHNWAGSDVELEYQRENITKAPEQRSCGRPFSPLLQVRAGGLDGHYGAVVACCMVLGKDSEAVLGHLDNQTIAEIVSDEKYDTLRQAHEAEQFSDIPYCANCDQLYDLPDSLVWSNIEGRAYGQSKIVSGMDHRSFTTASQLVKPSIIFSNGNAK
jgi:organic radical activating enzyme